MARMSKHESVLRGRLTQVLGEIETANEAQQEVAWKLEKLRERQRELQAILDEAEGDANGQDATE